MKKRKEALHALVLIVLSVFLGILLHGLFSCGDALPADIETGKVIDSFTVADSEATLYRRVDGGVFLLEYQKNWLLPRQELRERTAIDTEPFHTVVTSALAVYPVTATKETLAIDSQPEIRLRWGDFCLAYGFEILCFLLAGTLIYTKITKEEIQKTEEHHV